MSFFTRFVFPAFCLGCARPGVRLCFNCRAKALICAHQRCLYCGKSSVWGTTHGYCWQKFGVDGAFSFFYYQPPLVRLLKIAKYKHSKTLLYELLQNLSTTQIFSLLDFRKFVSPRAIVFMPQHIKDTRARGFNQSYLIAKYFSQITNVPIVDVLIKKRAVEKQAKLPYHLRAKNIKRALGFVNRKTDIKLKNSSVFLVDDVITSGETAKEAALVLKKHGVIRVFVISLFRAY